MTESRTLARLSVPTLWRWPRCAARSPRRPPPGSPRSRRRRSRKLRAPISPRRALDAPIRFLASDLLEGRGPATRADELTRLYLQTQLEGIGYQPAFAEWRLAATL